MSINVVQRGGKFSGKLGSYHLALGGRSGNCITMRTHSSSIVLALQIDLKVGDDFDSTCLKRVFPDEVTNR